MMALGEQTPPAGDAASTLPSMFGGHGQHGVLFNDLFVLFMIVCAIAYVLVLAFLALALVRAARRRAVSPPPRESSITYLLIGWTGFIVTGLAILTIASYLTDREMAQAEQSRDPLEITITGHQWWWEIEYLGDRPSERLRTANELHLPVNRPARISLRSNDVIHSFWVPDLGGKYDLIPGRTIEMVLVPTTTGVFRGQCAEFCGIQHARMAVLVIVHPETEFERWYAHQLAPASMPETDLARAGFRYVTGGECASCHRIAGTPASARIGPDLTHLASRRAIAAGTFPMTRGHLYGWVADPQSAKPGNRMPVIPLEPAELHGIVAYLETLR